MDAAPKPHDPPLPPTPVFLSTHAGKAPQFPTEVVIGSPLDLCVTGCTGMAFNMWPYKVWRMVQSVHTLTYELEAEVQPKEPSPKIQEIPDTPPRERRIVIDEP